MLNPTVDAMKAGISASTWIVEVENLSDWQRTPKGARQRAPMPAATAIRRPAVSGFSHGLYGDPVSAEIWVAGPSPPAEPLEPTVMAEAVILWSEMRARIRPAL